MKRILLIGLGALLSLPGTSRAQTAHAHGGDSARIEICTPARPGQGDECTAEAFLLRRLERSGVAEAMAALDSLAGVNSEVRRFGHAYAHAIGLSSLPDTAAIGSVFALCTPAFQSGCYHGVIQAYFDAYDRDPSQALDPILINRLCDEQRTSAESRFVLFQCVHGLGHGLMMAVSNHLPSALSGCDLLADEWEREGCLSAVFMENVVHATAQSDDVGRPPPAHDHETTHDHDPQTATAQPFPALDRSDLLYPCSVLAEKYLNACYQMQTSAILQLNDFDLAIAARACLSAPELFRSTCFASLGRDISALTVQDHRRALGYCDLAERGYRAFCQLGYAKNLVDLTADVGRGMEFCRLLTDGVSKRTCYTGMGEEIWVLFQPPARRVRECKRAETDYVQACRLGAGVEFEP